MTLNIASSPDENRDTSVPARISSPDDGPVSEPAASPPPGDEPASPPIDITMNALTEYASAVNAVKMIQEGKEQEGRLLKPPSAMAKVFVSAVRNAVLGMDQPEGIYETLRITPCVLDTNDDEFTKKASNFMDMCSIPAKAGANEEVEEGTTRPGHIKIEQAFRPKGNFVEGWVYVRWMEVGWRAAGFKAHRLGSLPLVMFTKDDENEALRDCLDRIMEEVYPVLVECFPHCHIVPVKPCEELWVNNAPLSKEGSELREALMRASLKKDGDSGEFSLGGKSSSRKLKSTSTLDVSETTNTTRPLGDLEAPCIRRLDKENQDEAADEGCVRCTLRRPTTFQAFACWSTAMLLAILFVVYGALFELF